MRTLTGKDLRLLLVCLLLAVASGALDAHPVGTVLPFAVAALALAALATLVGRLLAKQAAGRPADGPMLVALLQQAAAGLPTAP